MDVRKRRGAAPRLSEEPEGEIQLEKDEIPPRAGDPLPPEKVAKEFSRRREREAGLTGGSAGHPTADDASPETLLQEDQASAVDKILRDVDEAEIGGGHSKDEAELAEEQPVGRQKTRQARQAPDRGPGRMHSRNAARRSS